MSLEGYWNIPVFTEAVRWRECFLFDASDFDEIKVMNLGWDDVFLPPLPMSMRSDKTCRQLVWF